VAVRKCLQVSFPRLATVQKRATESLVCSYMAQTRLAPSDAMVENANATVRLQLCIDVRKESNIKAMICTDSTEMDLNRLLQRANAILQKHLKATSPVQKNVPPLVKEKLKCSSMALTGMVKSAVKQMEIVHATVRLPPRCNALNGSNITAIDCIDTNMRQPL